MAYYDKNGRSIAESFDPKWVVFIINIVPDSKAVNGSKTDVAATSSAGYLFSADKLFAAGANIELLIRDAFKDDEAWVFDPETDQSSYSIVEHFNQSNRGLRPPGGGP